MTDNLTKADDCARNLSRAYQQLGEFAIVIRTTPDNKGFRIITQQRDIPQLSEWLRIISERLFDGPDTQGVQKQ